MAWSSVSRRQFMKTSAAGALAAAAPLGDAWAQSGPKILRSRAARDPEILDPGWRLGTVEDDIMRSIFRGLVTIKAGDEWGWEKDLAEEIVQESPTRIRFRLKKGIPWSDNLGEVTAEDVKYSYERIANPEMKAAYRVDWEKLDKVEVTGTHTGVIILKQPFMPLWISTLPAGSGLIMCKKAMEKLPGQKFTTEVPAYCGPYRIKKFEAKRAVVLERNPLWPGEKPYYDEIHYIMILDANAAEIAYEAGELDVTILPIGSVKRLRAKLPPRSKLIVKPSLAYWWLGMQMRGRAVQGHPGPPGGAVRARRGFRDRGRLLRRGHPRHGHHRAGPGRKPAEEPDRQAGSRQGPEAPGRRRLPPGLQDRDRSAQLGRVRQCGAGRRSEPGPGRHPGRGDAVRQRGAEGDGRRQGRRLEEDADAHRALLHAAGSGLGHRVVRQEPDRRVELGAVRQRRVRPLCTSRA